MKQVKTFLWGGLMTVVGLVLMVGILLAMPAWGDTDMVYGVTFSAAQAEWITGGWREVYEAILVDLGVKHLRLSAYWKEIEPSEGEFDFSILDYQMDRAAEEGVQVILSIGRKLPRWPECHEPEWIKERPEEKIKEGVMVMLPVVVERYREHPALRMWQLENEPLLDFGGCPPEDREFLAQEEALVRSIDGSHPILVTDSGELNWWLAVARHGDVFGTTMYRTVHSQRTDRPFSYDYIFPSWLYRAKARLVKLVRGKETLISELQGEPWGSGAYIYMSREERSESFSPERFEQLRRFAERTQLEEAYWWGVEYWYWEKEVNNDSSYWNFAKTLF